MAYVREYEAPVERTRPSLIRWGAVFGGAVIGLGVLTLLTALWFALAYGSRGSGIRQNLGWFVGISAVVSLFLAGYFAGWLSSTRGWGAGLMNGLTIWGLLLIVTVGVGVPALLSVFNVTGAAGATAGAGGSTLRAFGVSNAPLWATFWSMLGALAAAGLGGAVGGATPRGDAMYGPQDRGRYERDGDYVDATGSETLTRDGATR